MWKKVLIALAVIVAGFVGVVAMQPSGFRVERTATISALPPAVFARVNDLHQFQTWSPWAKLDPAVKMTFEGPSAGTGAIYRWAGNTDVGEGSMTITESRPSDQVRMRLEFLKPFSATNTVEFTFKPEGDHTAVSWSMAGKNNFVAKLFQLFISMDKMVGGDFEKGLAQLKSVVEGESTQATVFKSGYAPVNGLKIYYEIHGAGRPLVLLHGGGSTIETSFGKVLLPFAKNRQVIAFEQQGHGRTADVDRPFSFEQSADDTAALLRYLKIERADFYGYSNGGNVALQIAIRHPELVRKLVVAAAMFKNDGLDPKLRESLKHASPEDMPASLREAYLKVAPNPEALPTFVAKCAKRMLEFEDWREEDLRSIDAPTMVMIGDADVVRPEHAVEMLRLLPLGQLAVLPGTDHMTLVERDDLLLAMIPTFLDSPMPVLKENQAHDH
ncbi:alpha/beta fold hydrolase [Singulisphaera sp. Ch08]|uniref:Alpha/beta fold hydrolase n=1 Tax=Singulisphaera sp. Ch08 TaxID=3120278 RepID=A0AAU7CB49_9BACT